MSAELADTQPILSLQAYPETVPVDWSTVNPYPVSDILIQPIVSLHAHPVIGLPVCDLAVCGMRSDVMMTPKKIATQEMIKKFLHDARMC